MSYSDFWKSRKVFLTGHTGFKGSWLSLMLNRLGADVYGYSLTPSTNPNLFEAAEIANRVQQSHIGNILDKKYFEDSLAQSQAEVVFHLAAQSLVRESYSNPIETYQANVMGTLQVLESIRNSPSVKVAVIVTTDKCYENDESGRYFSENDPLGGHDPYSSSKACAEILTQSFRKSFLSEQTVRVYTVRAGNVVGGGDWAKDRIITDICLALSRNKSLELRNPDAVRPWQHVLEPLGGYLKIAEKGFLGNLPSGAFNIGPDKESIQTVSWVVNEFAKCWGNELTIVSPEKPQPHEAKLLMLDNSKIKTEVGWKPTYSIEKTISLTANWYKRFYEDPKSIFSFTESQIDAFLEGK